MWKGWPPSKTLHRQQEAQSTYCLLYMWKDGTHGITIHTKEVWHIKTCLSSLDTDLRLLKGQQEEESTHTLLDTFWRAGQIVVSLNEDVSWFWEGSYVTYNLKSHIFPCAWWCICGMYICTCEDKGRGNFLFVCGFPSNPNRPNEGQCSSGSLFLWTWHNDLHKSINSTKSNSNQFYRIQQPSKGSLIMDDVWMIHWLHSQVPL